MNAVIAYDGAAAGVQSVQLMSWPQHIGDLILP